MRILVTGNCQADALTSCLNLMLPDAAVVRSGSGSSPEPDGFDIVFRQRSRGAWVTNHERPNEILYPRIWFNAFHPDFVALRGPAGPIPLHSPRCASSLILYAWERDMSVSDTVRLFSEPVFEHLKFFEFWNPARESLLEEGRYIGFRVEDVLGALRDAGCFMHMPAHPALIVMANIARSLVERIGLQPAVKFPERYLVDDGLTAATWPVYPEIAERLGLRGEYAFKGPQPARDEVPIVRSLPEFIALAFQAFASMPASTLVCPRLDTPLYRDLEGIAASGRRSASNGDKKLPYGTEFMVEAEPLAAREGILDFEMDPLAEDSMRIALAASLPCSLEARSIRSICCRVGNRGADPLVSEGNYPVYLSYRWLDANDAVTDLRCLLYTPLPGVIQPGDAADVMMALAAPAMSGTYALRVSLIQANVGWFDDIDPDNGLAATVIVEAV